MTYCSQSRAHRQEKKQRNVCIGSFNNSREFAIHTLYATATKVAKEYNKVPLSD